MMNFAVEPEISDRQRVPRKTNSSTTVEKDNLRIQPEALSFPDYSIVKNAKAKEETKKIMYMGFDLYEVIKGILQCLDHISVNRYYSTTILIATVRGGNRKQMEKDNLKSVPEYGMFVEMKRDDIRAIVQWLIDNHFILRTKEYYPKLHPTFAGRHFEETATLKRLKDLKQYLEDPTREIFEDDNTDENE
jgi:DNA helicase-4